MAKAEIDVHVGAKDQASSKLGKIGKNIDKMSGKFKKAGLAMVGISTAIGGGLLALTNKYSKAGDAISKMSKRTGFTTESLSELKHVAELSGSSLGDMEAAIRRISRVADMAGQGLDNSYTKRLEALGFTIEEFLALPQEQKFFEIAKAIGDIKDPAEKTAAAFELFGDAGTKLLPMLDDGSEAIDAMRQEAHDLNIVFSEDSADAAAAFEDAKERMKKSLEGFGATIATVALPKFQELITGITDIITKMTEWTKMHPELVDWIGKAAMALGAGGALLLAFSQVSKAIIAINTALVIMHGLMGPAGWAKLGVGILAAGAGLAALGYAGIGPFSGLFGDDQGSKYKTHVNVNGEWIPREEYERTHKGGSEGPTGPAPPSRPQGPPASPPSLGDGGIVTSPMLANIGDEGPEAVIPLDRGGFGDTFHIYVAGSLLTEDELLDSVRQGLLQVQFRNVTTGLQ